MYFEVYIDSLFWMNFVMNFYLLYLTNQFKEKTATGKRVVLGAFFGAIISCLIFLIPFFNLGMRLIAGGLVSGSTMAIFVFKVRTIKTMLIKLGNMTVTAFFLGGAFLFVLKRFRFIQTYKNQMLIFLFLGGVICMFGASFLERWKKGKGTICFVTLENNKTTKRVEALIDTGNTLVEPISGKPVSILNKELLKVMFDDELPELYRIVPFCSIGVEKGVLKCFEIPKMAVELEDTIITYEHIYVAYSDQYGGQERYQMILNPCLLH